VKTIHHVFDIDAPPDRVWAALTDRDGLANWWSTEVSTLPATIGVEIHFTFGSDFNPVMRITAIEPPHDLTWQCIAGHEPWQDSMFRFQVAELEDGRTRLRFWQDYAVELADDYYGVYNFNWGYYLESLRLYCVHGHGKPYAAAAAAALT